MNDTPIDSFEAFWPFYVREHRVALNRALHFVGTSAAMACLGAFALTRRKALLPLALVVGYGPAWVGHFFVEQNRPASFRHPLWSLRADLVMWGRTLAGTMAAEVERCTAEERAATNGRSDAHAEVAPPRDPNLH